MKIRLQDLEAYSQEPTTEKKGDGGKGNEQFAYATQGMTHEEKRQLHESIHGRKLSVDELLDYK